METVDEVVVAPPCHNNDVAKGKRTKRQRHHSPISFNVNNNNNGLRISPSFSTAAESTTTEEEDTARCLILLSRGYFLHTHTHKLADDHLDDSSNQNNRRPQTATDRGGGGMYACKTCNRVFSSFQALGGHRTSHKKPKNDKRRALFPDLDEDFPSPSSSKKRIPPSISLQLSSTATGGGRQLPYSRTHECSYCGAEFTSGQALGGHMRRHRAGAMSPLPSPAAGSGDAEMMPPEPKKPRTGLSLDLNFPAPEDETQRSGYGGAGREKSPGKLVISTSTPTLVDCHY